MKSSQGFDNISTKLLKSTIDEILIPLTHIINLSMQSGTVPEKMKIAKIIPIYKSGKKDISNNYHPISLLLALSNILHVSLFMHDYRHSKLPISFHNFFVQNAHALNVRNNQAVYRERAQTKFSSKLLKQNSPLIWN